jgi:inosine-uridine nucleoside N-ribohydrolase
MAQKIILDCDPGHDDALAILLACASPELEVIGITTVAGNAPVERTSLNALRVCELAGVAHIPVLAGEARPLVRALFTAEYAVGPTGLDGVSLPEATGAPDPRPAVDFIIGELRSRDDTVLVCTAPLTNIATAIIKEPQVTKRIREIVLMGGSTLEGNVTPSAEFNIYVDPHAAKVVFDSGIPVTMIGLNTTHQALATRERLTRIRRINTPVARIAVELIEFFERYHEQRYGMLAPPLHDPCAVAAVIDRSLITTKAMSVDIETSSELTIGRTVCDIRGITKQGHNAEVATTIDSERFFALLTERLARYVVA